MKLCCDCSHMDHNWDGEWDSFSCEKRHWEGAASVALIRENVRRAETCPDYTTEPVERPALTANVFGLRGE